MSEFTVLAGAEPFYAENGKVGVLVSHGYTGTPQSMRYYAEGLANAGFSVALPRLAGHGTIPDDMAQSTATEWIRDLEASMQWLQERCDTLFVTGLSMGGTLTLFMAGQYPDVFKGILPINALIFNDNPELAALVYNRYTPAELPGVGSDIKAVGVKELAYPVVPTPSLKELFALTKVADELLPRISCPALLFTSRQDHVVPPVNAEYILQKLINPDKRIVWLENSYHVATLDNDKDLILQTAIEFINTHK